MAESWPHVGEASVRIEDVQLLRRQPKGSKGFWRSFKIPASCQGTGRECAGPLRLLHVAAFEKRLWCAGEDRPDDPRSGAGTPRKNWV